MRKGAASLVVLTLVLGSACRSEESRTSAGATPAAQPSASGGTAAPPAQPQSSSAATATPGVRVGLRRTPELGAFLTDGNGRSLYLLEEDRAGESSCYEMCAAIWPPLLAGTAIPTSADSAVRGELLRSVPRRGGGSQVTYNGHPLYYYLGDAAPRQTRGQHVEDSWGEWYLVSPAGQHVGEDGSGRRGRRGRRGGDDR
jgi:predicted lipoprotein with Yx(FWY)xxD motif